MNGVLVVNAESGAILSSHQSISGAAESARQLMARRAECRLPPVGLRIEPSPETSGLAKMKTASALPLSARDVARLRKHMDRIFGYLEGVSNGYRPTDDCTDAAWNDAARAIDLISRAEKRQAVDAPKGVR